MISDYYVEIFLGISIGAFVTSLIFLASLLKKTVKAKTICESIREKEDIHKLPIEQR